MEVEYDFNESIVTVVIKAQWHHVKSMMDKGSFEDNEEEAIFAGFQAAYEELYE